MAAHLHKASGLWITPDGRVFRQDGRELKHNTSDRYIRVGTSGKHKLHRLIAETFIPNPDNLPWVNHKDSNKHNNSIDNLEWCTPTENFRHAAANNSTLKSEKAVIQIFGDVIINVFPSLREAERQTSVYASDISKTAKGKIKAAGGFEWKYV